MGCCSSTDEASTPKKYAVEDEANDEQKAEPAKAAAVTECYGALRLEYAPFPIVEIRQMSHDSKIFKFGLSSNDDIVGLPCAKHLMIKLSTQKDGKKMKAVRAYTPITGDVDKGYFELLIKIYSDGMLTSHLDTLNVGDTVDMKGPLGRIHYKAAGLFSIKSGSDGLLDLKVRKISMIAGGTGITPMWQVLRQIASDSDDNTEVALLFGNKTRKDILMYKELTALTNEHSNLTITYVLSKEMPDLEWEGETGYIEGPMMKQYLFPPSDDSVAMYCGPPGMERTVSAAFIEWGYEKDRVLRF